MSTSSEEVMQEVDKVLQPRAFPEWIGRFLDKTFFEKCPSHEYLQVNRYCITCDASTCKQCIRDGNHSDHETLTIYRHVYRDVVPLDEMENHINCANVQPFKCNKKWVVSLTPLPHKGSGSLVQRNGACTVCKRKLTDRDRFRFCSIVCKGQAISSKSEIQSLAPGVGTSQDRKEVEQVENKSCRKRSRKGVPHRAPLL